MENLASKPGKGRINYQSPFEDLPLVLLLRLKLFMTQWWNSSMSNIFQSSKTHSLLNLSAYIISTIVIVASVKRFFQNYNSSNSSGKSEKLQIDLLCGGGEKGGKFHLAK